MNRTKLLNLHFDFTGINREQANLKSEMELIFDILEQLCERSDEQDGHAHSIS